MHDNSTSALGSEVRILEGLALTFVSVVSLILNGAVCIIIWKTKILRKKPANTFVANLCIANLLMTGGVIPFSLVTIVHGEHGAHSEAACQANGFASVVSAVAMVMTLCCISMDRYIAVTRSTRYKAIVTVKRACYSLIGVWGQGLLYASFPLFGWSKYEYHPGTLHCSPTWADNCSLYIFLAVVGFGFPIIVMVFTYIRIFFVIRKHARKVSTIRRTEKLKCRSRTSNLLPLTQKGSDERLSKNWKATYDVNLAVDTNTRNRAALNKLASSNLELTSYEDCSKQYTSRDLVSCNLERKQDQAYMDKQFGNSFEQPSESTNSEWDSNIQRSKRGTMRVGNVFRRIHSNICTRKRQQGQLPREFKVAKTGVLLLVTFLILWLPYMVVHVCSAKELAPPVVFRLSMWLVFMNGVINPILYALCNSTLKVKFKQMASKFCAFCCKCRRKGKRTLPQLSSTKA